MGAYDYVAADVRPSGSLAGTDPAWVQQLRAQHAERERLQLQNPEGTRALAERDAAAAKRQQEYLFALATGGTGAQLGAEGPRNSERAYLTPEQTAQLLALRSGHQDAAQVLTGGAAAFTATAPESGTPWRTLLIGTGAAVLGALVVKAVSR